MISLLKKRRQQFTTKQLNQNDIERQQKLNELQIMKTKSYWKNNAKRLYCNLYEEQKKIDIENHEDEFDAEDVIIIPRLNKKMVKILDQSDKNAEENIVVLDDSYELRNSDKIDNVIVISTEPALTKKSKTKSSNKLINQIQIDKVNGNFNDQVINETFKAVKQDHDEDQKMNEDHNTSQSFQNNTFVQNVLQERIQKIKDKQNQNEGNNKQTNPQLLLPQNQSENQQSLKQLSNFGQENKSAQNNFQIVSQNNIQTQSYNNYQVFSSNNLVIPQRNNQQIQSSHNLQVVLQNNIQPASSHNLQTVSSNNLQEKDQVQILVDEEKEQEEEKEDQDEEVWVFLKSHKQTPIQFFSDVKFKGLGKINIQFGKRYEPVEIFRLLFSQLFYTHIRKSIYSKYQRQKNTTENEDSLNISSYDIDAFMGLLMQFNCLNHPNLMNTIRTKQSEMETNMLESICKYFSLGNKEDKDGVIDEMNKINEFLFLVNQKFQQILYPKEYLVLSQKTIEGNNFKSNSEYHVDEFRLYDSSQEYIVDLKFDKNTPQEKLQQDHIQKMIRTQGNMLDNFKNKSHKVVVLNQLFDADILRSLRKQGIGVITKSKIDNMQLTKRQLKMLSRTKQNINFFFLYEKEVCAAVTNYSFNQKFAFISNFIGLENQADINNSKMQQTYNDKGLTLDHKNVSQRDAEGVKWNLLVFLRILDAFIQNTFSLYKYLNSDDKVSKEIIQHKVGRELIKQYHCNRELQQRITAQKTNIKGEVRLHLFKEIQDGSKKVECIVCKNKTKNYCEICSAKRQQIVGFCGSANCNEKHNATIVELLNQQNDQSNHSNHHHHQNKSQYDRPYESSNEGSSRFHNKFNSFRHSDSRNDFNVVKNLSKKSDGYSSEAQLTFKSRNHSSRFLNDINDGHKTDTGSNSQNFLKKKHSREQSFMSVQQLANMHVEKYGNNMSLGDQLLDQKQNKKQKNVSTHQNSQEPQFVSKDNDKNYQSGGEKNLLKPKDFTQLKSRNTLQDLDLNDKELNQDQQNNDQNEQIKKKRQSKIPWYNTEEQEKQDREKKERDFKNSQEIISNPKVRNLLFESEQKHGNQGELVNKLQQNANKEKHKSKWRDPITAEPQQTTKEKHSQVQNSQDNKLSHKQKKRTIQFEEEEEAPKQNITASLNKSNNFDMRHVKNESLSEQNVFQQATTLAMNLSYSLQSNNNNASREMNKKDQRFFTFEEEANKQQKQPSQDKATQLKPSQQENSLGDKKETYKFNILDQEISDKNTQSKQPKNTLEKDLLNKEIEQAPQKQIEGKNKASLSNNNVISENTNKETNKEQKEIIPQSYDEQSFISIMNITNNNDSIIKNSIQNTTIDDIQNPKSDQAEKAKAPRQVIRNILPRRVAEKK